MKKILIFIVVAFLIGSYFLYDFYQSQLYEMENSLDHMMHRH